MNRNSKSIMRYVQMSLLLIILAVPVLYGAGKPLASYLISLAKMVMIKGAPGYPGEYSPTMPVRLSRVSIPELGAEYGSIHCGRIGLSAPLYYGDDDKALQNGAGQYPLSGLPGFGKPILISGHDDTFFAPLEQIEEGDIITIKTNDGSFEYEVTGTKITDSSDTTAYDLELDAEQLILYTCYPFGKLIGSSDGRIFIYCSPVLSE